MWFLVAYKERVLVNGFLEPRIYLFLWERVYTRENIEHMLLILRSKTTKPV